MKGSVAASAFIRANSGSSSANSVRPSTTPTVTANTIPKLARRAALSQSPSPRARATTELMPTITPTPMLVSATLMGKMKEIAASSVRPSWPMK